MLRLSSFCSCGCCWVYWRLRRAAHARICCGAAPSKNKMFRQNGETCSAPSGSVSLLQCTHRTSQTLPAPTSPHRIMSGLANMMPALHPTLLNNDLNKSVAWRHRCIGWGSPSYSAGRPCAKKLRHFSFFAPLPVLEVSFPALIDDTRYSFRFCQEVLLPVESVSKRKANEHLVSTACLLSRERTRQICRRSSIRLFRHRRASHAMRGTPTSQVSRR